MAAMMLVGMMFTSVSAMLTSALALEVSAMMTAERSRPTPGSTTSARPSAISTAIAVVSRYRAIVPKPTLPSSFGSDIAAAPHTIEQNTSGMTSICIRRMNHWPST